MTGHAWVRCNSPLALDVQLYQGSIDCRHTCVTQLGLAFHLVRRLAILPHVLFVLLKVAAGALTSFIVLMIEKE